MALDCEDCRTRYCRDHYHAHDCDPQTDTTSAGGPRERESIAAEWESAIGEFLPVAGYSIAVLIAGWASWFLYDHLDVVISGGEAAESFEQLMSVVVAGSLFSLATFLLVGSYILSQHSP